MNEIPVIVVAEILTAGIIIGLLAGLCLGLYLLSKEHRREIKRRNDHVQQILTYLYRTGQIESKIDNSDKKEGEKKNGRTGRKDQA